MIEFIALQVREVIFQASAEAVSDVKAPYEGCGPFCTRFIILVSDISLVSLNVVVLCINCLLSLATILISLILIF